MEIFTTGGKLLRGGILEVPQLVLHPAVELLGILLPLHVEFHADRRVDAHREVIVDDVVGYAVLVRLLLVLLIRNLDLPTVHHHLRCLLYFLKVSISGFTNDRAMTTSLLLRADEKHDTFTFTFY